MSAFQFVDAISGSPTVLLDLDDQSPLSVVASSVNTPPDVRYGRIDRALVDGANITSDQWDDRQIRLDMTINEVAAATQATTLQTLARIVARGGAWLKWHPDGLTHPVFFLTKKPEFSIDEEILSATPRRKLQLTIPAEPFAFGLPESGTMTFRNDPTTAGGGEVPMMGTLPTIKGDVPAPLGLSFSTPEADHNVYWASVATMVGTAQSACYWKPFSGETINSSPGSDVTVTDVADANSISGTVRRVARSSGVTYFAPADGLMQSWASLPAGDYRAFIRIKGADSTAAMELHNRIPDSVSGSLGKPASSVQLDGTVQTAVYDWIDMGVIAMPFSSPSADNTFGLAPAPVPAPWTLRFNVTGNMSIDLDGILLVPAGRPGLLTRMGSIGFSPFYVSKAVTIEPLADQWYAMGESSYTSGVTSPAPVTGISGSAPQVVPGAVANQLHFMATTSINAESLRNNPGAPAYYDRISDSKATTTTVSWKYFPRYLHVRAETT